MDNLNTTNITTQQIAADIYHSYLEEAHGVLEDFNIGARPESLNKMNILWNQLHMAGGAKYIYADALYDDFSSQWLSSKGKQLIDELIEDAKKSKMNKALKTLKELRQILEDKHLIN